MNAPPSELPSLPAGVLGRLPEDLRFVCRRAWDGGIPPVADVLRWLGQFDFVSARKKKVSDAPAWCVIRDGDDDMRVNAAVACLAWLSLGWRSDYEGWGGLSAWFNLKKVLGGIRFRKGRVTAQQAKLLCRLAGADCGEGVAVGACVAFIDGGGSVDDIAADVRDLLERLTLDDVDKQAGSVPGIFGAPYAESADLARRRVQLEELLGRPAQLASDGDSAGLVDGTDAVATWARAELGSSATEDLAPLVRHLRRGIGGVKPSSKWTTTTRELLRRAPEGRDFIARLLTRAGGADLRTHADVPVPAMALFDQSTQELLRAAVWASSIEVVHGVEDRLLLVARRCGERVPNVGPPAPKVCTAAIHALATIGSPAAVAALSELERRLKNPSLLNQVDKALSGAADRAASSRARLQETSIPDLGLGADGSVTVELSPERRAIVRLRGRNVTTTWCDGDRALKSVPTAWREALAGAIKAVQGLAAKLRTALANERARQEGLLFEEDVWPFVDWRRTYLEHPIASAAADGLIWSFEYSNTILSALAKAGALVDAHGRVVDVPDSALVKLWHPLDAPVEEVEAWRSHLVGAEIHQPFKQAFREVYLVTPAEIECGDHSRRFAEQLLDAMRLYMLVKERHWAMPRLGGWDGGYDAAAKRRIPGTDLTAHFWAEASLEDTRRMASTCITGDVRFVRGSGRKAESVRLDDVAPRAFSEIMRDVDLFVSVCSLATSPEWMLRHGGDPDAASLLRLQTPVAATRTAALERILPALRIADRCGVSDGFVCVDGRRHSYRIHIGSGHVFREPGSRYVCIVPKSIGPARGVFLPFDDDTTLTVILSTALLLADDDKITDESILAQLH